MKKGEPPLKNYNNKLLDKDNLLFHFYFVGFIYFIYLQAYILIFQDAIRIKLVDMMVNDKTRITLIIAVIYFFLTIITLIQFLMLRRRYKTNSFIKKIRNYGMIGDFGTRLLPIIGILGTLIGLTSMVLNLSDTMETHFQSQSQEALAAAGESFAGIFKGFSTAFNTTLFATLASILLAIKIFILERAVDLYFDKAGLR
jgi:hypothetical protein